MSSFTDVGSGGGAATSLSGDVTGATSLAFGTNPATAGYLRGANNADFLMQRNAANSANVAVAGVDNTNNLWIGTTIAGGSRAVITFIDASTDVRLGVNGSGKAVFAAASWSLNYATVATATAGVGVLPATPEAFLPVTVAGTSYMVPLYKP